MAIKVASFGSCATRDNFNSKINKNYKEKYECVATSNHSSIISLMSPKVNYIEEKLDCLSNEHRNYHKNNTIKDLDKSFLSELVISQPDYLIMDFFPDVHFGILVSNKNTMTNNHWFLCNTTFYDELPNKLVLKVVEKPAQFLQLWILAFDNFIKFVNENIPNCKIIINKARFVNQVLDNNEITYLPSKSGFNSIWDKLDTFVISKYKLDNIELDHSNYYLTKKHTLGWNLFQLHFHDNYYHDFLKELDLIVI